MIISSNTYYKIGHSHRKINQFSIAVFDEHLVEVGVGLIQVIVQVKSAGMFCVGSERCKIFEQRVG